MEFSHIIRGKIRGARQYWAYRQADRIILGAGGTIFAGWLSTDVHKLDVTCRDDFLRYWRPKSREIFVAEHVWEHLSCSEAADANHNCYEFLRPGGRLRIAVPDGFHPDPNYIEAVRPGGSGAGADDHKVLYVYKMMREMLEEVGFEVTLLEYWDENGTFHFREWHMKDGPIRRSSRNDHRNNNGELRYTSLIVDAVRIT